MLRNITLLDGHGHSHSTSLILCDNLECQNYGQFKQQTSESIVQVETCDACKALLKSMEASNAT